MDPNIPAQPTPPTSPGVQIPIAQAPQLTAYPQVQTPSVTPLNPNNPSKRNVYILTVVLIILLILVVTGGGAYYLGVVKHQFTFQKSNNISMPSVKPTLSITPTPDPTANWQTNTDSDNIYSIKYPQNWNKSLYQTVGITSPANIQVLSHKQDVVLSGPEGKVNIAWTDSYGGNCDLWTEITVGTKTVKVCDEKGTSAQNIESFNNMEKETDPNTHIGIVIDATANAPATTTRNLILQILSTLKFTNPSVDAIDWKTHISIAPSQTTISTTGWQTFTDAKGKYSFKYPPPSIPKQDPNGIVSMDLSSNIFSVSTEQTNLTLNNYVGQSLMSLCGVGKPSVLGSEASLRFDKTNCGQIGIGSTAIIVVHNGTAYNLSVATHENYDTIVPTLDQILSTFKFTQ